MTASLGLLKDALSLVCAFSAPDCAAARTVPISIQPLQDRNPNAIAETVWRDGQPVAIHIHPAITHPAAVAALIVHEGTNARAGFHRECGEWEAEAYAEQARFIGWVNASFGPPALSGANVHARDSAMNRAAHPC
jgi:hypothetical protein